MSHTNIPTGAAAGRATPTQTFEAASEAAQDMVDQLLDGMAEGAANPMSLALLTEAQRTLARQVELMSNVSKAGHETAMAVIQNMRG